MYRNEINENKTFFDFSTCEDRLENKQSNNKDKQWGKNGANWSNNTEANAETTPNTNTNASVFHSSYIIAIISSENLEIHFGGINLQKFSIKLIIFEFLKILISWKNISTKSK